MPIPATFSLSSVVPLGVARLAGLRHFGAVLAASAGTTCARSSLLGSIVRLQSLLVSAAGSNPAVKRTCLRQAAYLVR
ncbi:DUF1010 domain-containing protein [Ottowia oryzae]|uniref:DUF1010 domain-containing protein n=1 Tax=Ottowia oryzae TaxID=2109914 RepID=UPI003CCBAB67